MASTRVKKVRLGWGFVLVFVFFTAMVLSVLGLSDVCLSKKVIIKCWLTGLRPEGVKFFTKKIYPAFEEKYPDIKVEWTMLTWRNWIEKLLTSYAAGLHPDISMRGAEDICDVAGKRMGIPIDDYLAEWGQKDDFYQAVWGSMTWQDKIYGLPTSTYSRCIVWRKDIFAEVGLDPEKPPEFWGDLTFMARKLNKRDAAGRLLRAGWVVLGKPFEYYKLIFLYTWQAGGEILSKDLKKATFNNPATIEALEFMVSLYENLFPPGMATALPESPIPHFATGMEPLGWGIPTRHIGNVLKYVPERMKDVGVAPPLRGPARKEGPSIGQVFTSWIHLSSQSKHPDEAWELMKFITSPEAEVAWDNAIRGAGYRICRKSATVESEFLKECPQAMKMREYMKYGRAMAIFPETGLLRKLTSDVIEKAMTKEWTITKTIDYLDREWNKILTAFWKE